MFRLILWGLIVYLAYRVLKSQFRIGGQAGTGRDTGPPDQVDDLMVQDPACGVYFPKKDAYHLRFKGKDLYFCSPACRDKYRSDHAGKDA